MACREPHNTSLGARGNALHSPASSVRVILVASGQSIFPTLPGKREPEYDKVYYLHLQSSRFILKRRDSDDSSRSLLDCPNVSFGLAHMFFCRRRIAHNLRHQILYFFEFPIHEDCAYVKSSAFIYLHDSIHIYA